jgi:hypothetical protein
MKKGSIVKIKPEWDGGSEAYVVKEWNGDRGMISPLEWAYGSIIPTELVREDMLELVK